MGKLRKTGICVLSATIGTKDFAKHCSAGIVP